VDLVGSMSGTEFLAQNRVFFSISVAGESESGLSDE
jgi:hypothetical protein